MRGVNPGSIFFFVFIFMMLSGMGIPVGILIPIFIFFSIASSMSKQKQSQRKRGYVRESTRKRRTEQRDRARTPRSRVRTSNKPLVTRNPFKKSGVDKYKDFDYDGAIDDFRKALQIEERDPAVHFNLACAYSLTEQKDLAFEHLAKAKQFGFKDVERIKSHDALAFLRVQEEFDQFEAGGFRWPMKGLPKREASIVESPGLLKQLNQLAELKEKGLLSEEEFQVQRKKLLR